jgi:hypothetical protein
MMKSWLLDDNSPITHAGPDPSLFLSSPKTQIPAPIQQIRAPNNFL